MLSDEVRIVNAFKYWSETNTEKGVTSIPDYICKGLLDLYQKEKEKNKKLMSKIDVTNWQEKMSHEILDEKYISKDKIKAKIKELEKMYNNLSKNPKEHLHSKTECKIVIGELQSLLKKE